MELVSRNIADTITAVLGCIHGFGSIFPHAADNVAARQQNNRNRSQGEYGGDCFYLLPSPVCNQQKQGDGPLRR
jgi:hypothetical protein